MQNSGSFHRPRQTVFTDDLEASSTYFQFLIAPAPPCGIHAIPFGVLMTLWSLFSARPSYKEPQLQHIKRARALQQMLIGVKTCGLRRQSTSSFRTYCPQQIAQTPPHIRAPAICHLKAGNQETCCRLSVCCADRCHERLLRLGTGKHRWGLGGEAAAREQLSSDRVQRGVEQQRGSSFKLYSNSAASNTIVVIHRCQLIFSR